MQVLSEKSSVRESFPTLTYDEIKKSPGVYVPLNYINSTLQKVRLIVIDSGNNKDEPMVLWYNHPMLLVHDDSFRGYKFVKLADSFYLETA